ncbi:MAG: DUF6444 domain-containing protein [Planctomycetes bacterium]|nr:DUF6444 domain-containing protein [Planctomycetota bacterium]
MADKDVTISQLVLQIDLRRSQVFALEQTNAQLRADNQKLQDQVARLTRDSSNSSKPPSSDIVKPQPQQKDHRQARRNRPIGGRPGHPREERTPFDPDQIDRTIHHELSPVRSCGLVPLEAWSVLPPVELAERLYPVIEHRARKYLDPRTGRIVIAPLPRGVQAAGLVGPRLTALAAYQKGDGHVSYTTIRRFREEVLGLPISRSQLVNVVQKVAAAFETPYEELREAGFAQEKECDTPQALTRRQIEAMKGPVHLQSHTLFHPSLPRCGAQEARQEIFHSREMLSRAYAPQVNAIAYPRGNYSNRDIELCRRAGYHCGITVQRIAARLDGGVPIEEKHLPIHPTDTLRTLRARLRTEDQGMLYAALQKMAAPGFQPPALPEVGQVYTRPNFRQGTVLNLRLAYRRLRYGLFPPAAVDG